MTIDPQLLPLVAQSTAAEPSDGVNLFPFLVIIVALIVAAALVYARRRRP